MIEFGITFDGDKHTYRDFGLICTALHIGLPEIKDNVIPLKGADGYIDLTEIFGRTMYGNRTIKAEFVVKELDEHEWAVNISNLANYLHGRRRKIVLDNDSEYYYDGRITEEHEKEYRPYSKVVLTMDCAPYKKEIQNSSLGDWLWDPFDLNDGIIREYGKIEVDGSYTMNIIGLDQKQVPVIYSTAAMTVMYKGMAYDLTVGKNYIYGIVIESGENVLVFHGNGVISVEYRGGKL